MGFSITNGIFYGDLPYDPLASAYENKMARQHAVDDQLRTNFSHMIGEVKPQPYTPWTPEQIEAWKKTDAYTEYLEWRDVHRQRRMPYDEDFGS